MYTTCLRCERSLGRNAELPHLPIGRRVAFDTTTGRVWVICTACGQWNLVPTEERWEALADCDRVAHAAEARAVGTVTALARTASGMELLRVGSLPDEEIANWRYGRRVRVRQRQMLAVWMALGAASGVLGYVAARSLDAPSVGLYIAVAAGTWVTMVVRNPPRLWLRVADGRGGRYLLWPWQIRAIELADDREGRPVLVVPHACGVAQLRGERAVVFLSALLPVLNAIDSTGVKLTGVLRDVHDAEARAARPPEPPDRATRRRAEVLRQPLPTPVKPRPWESLVSWHGIARPAIATPAHRLALEMMVTEELERSAMRARAEAMRAEWDEEEEIGRIADDLLVPDALRARLRALREERKPDP